MNIFKTAVAAEKPSQSRWTKREEIDLARFLSEGKSLKQIATLMGRTFYSIQNKHYKSLKKIAATTINRKKRWKGSEDRLLRSMIKDNRNREQISAALNRSVSSISTRKHQLGIRKRLAQSPRKSGTMTPILPHVAPVSQNSMMQNLNKAINEAKSLGMKLSVTIESE